MNKLFPNMCRFVVKTLGRLDENLATHAYVGCWMEYGTPCICYEDDTITIVAATDSLSLLVIRKENNNPILGVKPNGEVYRWHGEAGDLYNHLFNLLQKANDEVKEELDKYNENARQWKAYLKVSNIME